jgi:RNA polymerase sigma factor (sigma-70 family)
MQGPMEASRYSEEQFRLILENYSKYMMAQVQHYDLSRYGLDPEDILQEVKIRIWNLLRRNRTIACPAPYIRKIVSSAVIDQLRKRRRDESLYHHEKQKRISEQEETYRWETIRKKALEETVGKAVDRLISSRRQVVKLYLLNLTIQEIAGYLNWSHDKTRNLLYRGLADLKMTLKDMEAENKDEY